jgi:tetratricopeptide (TPR) repeat protein
MARISNDILATGLVVIVAFAAVFGLSGFVEGARPKLPRGFEDTDLTMEGKRLKGYALGTEGLLADWYWIMSLQYLGSKLVENPDVDVDLDDLTNLNPRLLYPYLDNATDLDPNFYAAYSYGAIVLPAIDPQKAIELTEKGIRNNPDKWRLHQYLGYIYWREKNYEKAAETYESGAKISGAPPFMLQMAALMRSEGGSRDVARAMYQQMLTEAEDEQSKRNAQLRLYEIAAAEELDAVNGLLTAAEATGRCPSKLAEVFTQLSKIQLPNDGEFRIDRSGSLVDPTGVPYDFDSNACKAKLNKDSKIPKPLN